VLGAFCGIASFRAGVFPEGIVRFGMFGDGLLPGVNWSYGSCFGSGSGSLAGLGCRESLEFCGEYPAPQLLQDPQFPEAQLPQLEQVPQLPQLLYPQVEQPFEQPQLLQLPQELQPVG
jgi:hypothetical protein